MTENKPKFDLNLIYILIVIILVNIISYFMFTRFDFTEGKIYSLSDASKKLVSNLDDRVIVKCFFSKELPPQLQIVPAMVKNNLDEYQTYSNGNFHYEFIDPSHPDFSEQIMNYQLPSAQVQMLEKDEFKVKRVFMGMVILYGDKKEIIPFIQEGDLSSLEYEITSRIRKITLDRLPVIGLLSGYGSAAAEDFRNAYNILSSQYVVKPVTADKNSLMPDKIDALLIIGPKEDLPQEALNAIDSYIMSGGKAGFFVDKTEINLKTLGVKEISTNLDSLMMSYGVKVNNDLVGDRQAGFISVRQQKGFFSISNQIKYPFLPQVTNVSRENIITQKIDAVNFYFTSSLDTSYAEGKNIELEVIARTSDNAFTQSGNYYIMADRDINDYKYSMSGIPLAAVMKGSFTSYADSTVTGVSTRLAVTGDADFFQDGKFNAENDLNMFLNIVDWLTADDSLISIRSKNIAVRPLKELTEGKKSIVKWLNIVSIPFLIIILGLIKWRKNRTRKDFSL
ncbi:MAG: GldG family protein [Candidatus Delongbacteria bacterium]|nr:GldG family protein [Candidatus Delongbacteria bacterium]